MGKTEHGGTAVKLWPFTRKATDSNLYRIISYVEWGCSYFLSFFSRTSLPTQRRCRGWLFRPITLNHTYTRKDYPGRGIGSHWDLYLKTHNNHKRETTKLPERFEPAIPTSEKPQTYALDRAAVGIGLFLNNTSKSHDAFLQLLSNSSVTLSFDVI